MNPNKISPAINAMINPCLPNNYFSVVAGKVEGAAAGWAIAAHVKFNDFF